MNKFAEVTFPIFTLKKKPELQFSSTQVKIGSKILDDRELKGKTYLERLTQLEINTPNKRVHFDYTVTNFSALIQSDSLWGIDNTGRMFDFSTKQLFPFKCTKVKKRIKDVFWVDKISYPFILPKHLLEIDTLNEMWVYLIKLNYTWYLYKFAYEPLKKENIII